MSLMIVDGIEDAYPLAPIQLGMLLHTLSTSIPGAYCLFMVAKFNQDLHTPSFWRAWSRVAERHPIMRTSFHWRGLDEPYQEVHHKVQIPIDERDLRAMSSAEQDAFLEEYLRKERQRGFDLEVAPLFRMALFRLGEMHYCFLRSLHHLISDGRSTALMYKEAFAFYQAFLHSDDLHLASPPNYRDYVDWIEMQDFTKSESFWRSKLEGFSAPTQLLDVPRQSSVDDPLEEQSVGRYGGVAQRLPPDLTTALRGFAGENQITLNTLIQGAWALLLSRYSGETDVVFGATRACRASGVDRAAEIVGPLINTLPLRVDVDPGCKLVPWLQELRAQWVEMRPFEHTPPGMVQAWSDVLPGEVLFESITDFNYRTTDSTLRSIPGGFHNPEYRVINYSGYPLALGAYADESMLIEIGYERKRFNRQDVARMLGHLQTLLSGMIENPEGCLRGLPMLPDAERTQLLVDWSGSQLEAPQRVPYQKMFEAQAARSPEALAVVREEVGLTYRQLNARANQLAHYLRGVGISPEDKVVLCVDRSPETIVAILGILKAGAAYVPLDLDSHLPQMQFILADTAARLVITRRNFDRDLAPESVQVLDLIDDRFEIEAQSETDPECVTLLEHLAYVIYTSGSTGSPKGVMIRHNGLAWYASFTADYYDIAPQDRVLLLHSLMFDGSVLDIFPTLCYGATLVIRNEAMLSSVKQFLETCGEWGITIINLPTAFWHELTNRLVNESLHLPSSFRAVSFGGEKASPERVEDWRRYVGEQVRLVNGYGPTETTVSVIAYQLSGENNYKDGKDAVLIGRTRPGARIFILDRELRPVPVGVYGELFIGGECLGRGYLNQPESTAERFIPDPFSRVLGERLYRTGDLARYWEDGNIEFLGRSDHQVKIRGYRVELEQVEALLNQHPSIDQTVVLAKEIEPGDQRMVAYVIPVPGAEIAARDLRIYLQARLPKYMVPSAFVLLEAMPITSVGKIDLQALPFPREMESLDEEGYLPPETMVERALAVIWAGVFNVEKIGVADNFFELGGDSLMVMRLNSAIRGVFQIEIPMRAIFERPTVSEMGPLVEELVLENIQSLTEEEAARRLKLFSGENKTMADKPGSTD